MAIPVLMPQLGLTMTEGLLTEWSKKEGDEVRKGDLLFSVENDKAVLPVESQADGILANVSARAGDVVPVGTPVALILAAGETAPTSAQADSGARPAAAPAVPAAWSTAAPAPAEAPSREAAPAAPIPTTAAVPKTAESPTQKATDGFVLASPRARHLASAAGLDLGSIPGTGPGGAVVERDLPVSARAADPGAGAVSAASRPSASPSPGTFAAAPGLPGGSELVTLPRVGQVGAERMAKSWAEIPQFTLYAEACASELLRIHARGKEAGNPASVTVLLAGLLARALRDFPRLNASWEGNGRVRTYRAVNVGVAVDGPDGLVVPVLRDCGIKGFSELARELAGLAERAKTRTLYSDDLSGGTVTLSNLGMFGIKRFRAIVNPPQTAILAAGAVERKPVETEDGDIRFLPYLEISVTADHRAVDGAYAARFLARYKELIEDPQFALF
ncbi:MAG TPA: dihydrolipoamide acetyltransferase family protein [Spirochaetia bacterium]|nr:dihydrolipoamide acetyltransferase family protein [Spirochaetales bacterium]HRY79879.1 dihydrolipoamide acetyltransferase family protein [Spirochaetia bacterium]